MDKTVRPTQAIDIYCKIQKLVTGDWRFLRRRGVVCDLSSRTLPAAYRQRLAN